MLQGKVHKYGADANTDVIIPARYLNVSESAELARHCMEDIDKDFLNRVHKRRSVVFLISDFLGRSARQTMAVSNKRHDLVAITVADPREHIIPDVGFISLRDAETGEIVELDTSHREVRALVETRAAERTQHLSSELKKVGVDELPISTGEDYLKSLRRFFYMRERRLR